MTFLYRRSRRAYMNSCNRIDVAIRTQKSPAWDGADVILLLALMPFAGGRISCFVQKYAGFDLLVTARCAL